MWRRMEAVPFAESSSPSLRRAIVLVSPYLPWADALCDKKKVGRWATAASAVQFTEEVSQSVFDVLLQIASESTLRLHIPDGVWAFLKKRVSFPPVCRRRSLRSGQEVVLRVRGLGDINIIKSYYPLV